ncbi:MAG: hypothetical protein ABIH63_01185 [archaeon]
MVLESINRTYDLYEVKKLVSYTEPINLGFFKKRIVEVPKERWEDLPETKARLTKELLDKLKKVFGEVKIPAIEDSELEEIVHSNKFSKFYIVNGAGREIGLLDFNSIIVHVEGYHHSSCGYTGAYDEERAAIKLALFGNAMSPDQYNKLESML